MKAIVQTPTNNIKESLSFYTKLHFQIVSEEQPCIVSDGKAVIEINPSRFARAGAKLYRDDWSETVAKLEQLTKVIKIDDGYLLSDPSNTWIYLIEGEGLQRLDLPEENSGTLGKFAGMSLEMIDVEKGKEIWEVLGFSKTMGDLEQGWIVLANDEGFGVSLMKPNMCPHLCFNPSMTYFNGGQNLPVIQKIRDAGIPIAEEITQFNKEGIVDNVIIRDPGGYGFYVFND